MKKLLFVAALGVASLVSAKEFSKKSLLKNPEKQNKKLIDARLKNLPYQWVKVNSPCGEVYWIQAANYRTVSDALDAIDYFNEAKCG